MNQGGASADRPARGGAAWWCCAGVVAMALLVGCAVTPETRKSLDGYVLAMGQVEQSANLFLNDFAEGLKAQDKAAPGGAAAAAAPAYPDTFDPAMPLSETDDALLRTREALQVVRQYNDVLVALAEGRSEQEVRDRAVAFGGALESLASIAGTAIPGLGLFTALGPKIIKLAQDAANREQLVRAVKDGREPVGVILKSLEAQTSALYALSVVGTKQGQTKVQNDMRRVASVLKTLIAAHGPPAAPELVSKVTATQVQLADLGTRTGTLGAMPTTFAFGAGKPAYDAAAHAQVEVFVQALRTSADQYADLVARQNAYHELMKKYVATLRETGRALELVEANLAKPVDLRFEANRLLKVAFELRDGMAAYRAGQPMPAAAP